MIKLDLTRTLIGKGDEKSLKLLEKKYGSKMHEINAMIELKSGLGSDFLGWTSYPTINKKPMLDKIKETASAMILNKQLDTLVVIGVGGSRASKAMIEAINGFFPGKKQPVNIIYAGDTVSATYIKQLIEELGTRNYAINFISKDASTLETSLTFRLLRRNLEDKHGVEEASSRIIITTSANCNLKPLAIKNKYKLFEIPEDIVGRYAIMTPVTLVPMAFAGIDIYQYIEGAKKAIEDTKSGTISTNSAMAYACYRHWCLESQKKTSEIFGTFEKQLKSITQWHKQLFAESEGKDGNGILPIPATFSGDLHRMGQFIQEGSKIFFETIIRIKEPSKNLEIQKEDYSDEMQFVEGMTLSQVNDKVMSGSMNAHANNAGVPVLTIELDNMQSKAIGYLVQWMLKSSAISAYMFKVNPFNNPGIEVYKNKMFKLLGKKEY